MKNLIIFLSLTLFIFSSCKKEKHEYHKVTFETTFLGKPGKGSSNFIEIDCLPNYIEKKPTIDRFKIPQVWRYEYWALEKGQTVRFQVSGQLSYHFEMRVYIDGVQVSYAKVRVSDYSYYASSIEESSGLNDKLSEDMGLIQFVYN